MSEMEIFGELIKKEPSLLSKPIEELVPISFVGQAAVTAYKGLISKLSDLPMSEEQKQKTLKDGQDAGKMLLAIEARIGELIDSYDEKQIYEAGVPGSTSAYPKEIAGNKNKRKRDHAKQIKDHPKEVEEVIQEAEENEDIPTKTAVLNKIKYKKEKERHDKAVKEGRNKKTELEMRLDEQEYLLKLRFIVSDLPVEPPKDWSDNFFKEAKALALIIINRLEIFNE